MQQETIPYLDVIPAYRKQWFLERRKMSFDFLGDALRPLDQCEMAHYQSLAAAQQQIATTQSTPADWYRNVFLASDCQNERPRPRAKLLDKDFEYTSAAATDITKTWRKFGWVPLSEQTK